MRAAPDDRPRGWGTSSLRRTTLTLAATQLVSWGILVYAFGVASPAIVAETGWSEPLVAGAFSFGLLVSGLAAPAVADRLVRHGPRRVLSIGSAFAATGLVAFAGAHHPLVLYGAFALIGVAMATTLYEPAMSVVVAIDPGRRQRSLAAITLAGGLASTVFAPATSLLVGWYGWRSALVVLAAGGAGATLALHASLPATHLGPSLPTAAAAPHLASHPVRQLRDALLVEQVAATATTAHAVGLLVDRGTQLAVASTVLGAMGLGKVAGRLLLLSPAAQTAPGRLAVRCSLAQGAGLAVPLISRSVPLLLAAVVTAGVGSGAATVTRPLLIVEHADVGSFAAVSARIQRSIGPARAVAPFALGAAVAVVGWTAAWALSLVAFGLAADRYRRLDAQVPRTPATTEGRNVRPDGTPSV